MESGGGRLTDTAGACGKLGVCWVLAGFSLQDATDGGRPWPARDLSHQMFAGTSVLKARQIRVLTSRCSEAATEPHIRAAGTRFRTKAQLHKNIGPAMTTTSDRNPVERTTCPGQTEPPNPHGASYIAAMLASHRSFTNCFGNASRGAAVLGALKRKIGGSPRSGPKSGARVFRTWRSKLAF